MSSAPWEGSSMRGSWAASSISISKSIVDAVEMAGCCGSSFLADVIQGKRRM